MKSIESIDKTAKSIVAFDSIDYRVYHLWQKFICPGRARPGWFLGMTLIDLRARNVYWNGDYSRFCCI